MTVDASRRNRVGITLTLSRVGLELCAEVGRKLGVSRSGGGSEGGAPSLGGTASLEDPASLEDLASLGSAASLESTGSTGRTSRSVTESSEGLSGGTESDGAGVTLR